MSNIQLHVSDSFRRTKEKDVRIEVVKGLFNKTIINGYSLLNIFPKDEDNFTTDDEAYEQFLNNLLIDTNTLTIIGHKEGIEEYGTAFWKLNKTYDELYLAYHTNRPIKIILDDQEYTNQDIKILKTTPPTFQIVPISMDFSDDFDDPNHFLTEIQTT